MSNRLTLLGLRDLNIEEEIDPNCDYGFFLIGSLVEKAFPCTFEDTEKDFIKYKVKIERVEQILNLKSGKQVDFQHGKTPSQKLRWLIEQNLGSEEYSAMINYLMSRIDGLCDDYRDMLTVNNSDNNL